PGPRRRDPRLLPRAKPAHHIQEPRRNPMKSTVLGALVLSSLLAAGTARAQNLADTINSTTFGNPGQVAISGDFDISFTHENDTSTLVLAPAIDYFAIPQLSFGGQVLFS